MGSNYVVKLKYEDTLRRITLESDNLDFSQLEIRIRDLFQVPAKARLILTYTDKDGDIVTMTDDEDLNDALLLQSLNPLRLVVRVAETKINVPVTSPQQESDSNTAAVANAAMDLSRKKPEKDCKMKVETGGMAPATSPVKNGSTDDGEAVPIASKLSETETENVRSATNLATATGDSQTSETSKDPASEEKDGGPVHHGVRCDGCGTSPLKGPRFKSTVNFNYDLCESCFQCSGSDPGEYVKIERIQDPLRNTPFHPFWSMNRRTNPQSRPVRCCNGRVMQSNSTDSFLSSEQTKVDSTKESPSGQVGRFPIPTLNWTVACDGCGTSPIRGPRLISKTKWNYDLCLDCFEKSGESLLNFHRVDEGAHENCEWTGANIMQFASLYWPYGHRLHPGYFWVEGPHKTPNETGEMPMVPKEEARQKEDEGNTALKTENDSIQIESEKKFDATSQNMGPSRKTEENTNTSNKENGGIEMQALTGDAAEVQVKDLTGDSSATQVLPSNETHEDEKLILGTLSLPDKLLAKLATMGFTNQKLNSDLLEINKLDLRKTVLDLLAAEEWDPILKNLEEMGFVDTTLNLKLLSLHDGNVKRVVKDLVKASNSPSAKGPKQA